MGESLTFGSVKDGEEFFVLRGDTKLKMRRLGAYAKCLDNGDIQAMVSWQEVEK